MGLLTFTQIKSEITSNLGNRTDIASRLNTVVDLSQMRIARLKDWEQLELLVRDALTITATIQDDKTYDITSGLPAGYKIKSLYNIRVLSGDGRSGRIIGKSRQEFDRIVPEPEFYSRGFPEIYTRVSSINAGVQINPAIELWRVPDVAYTIELRMQVWPRFLTDSGKLVTDKSDLEVDDALIHLSTSYLYNSFGREDKARFHFGIYRDIINNAEDLDNADYDTVMAGVNVESPGLGEYWNNPFIRDIP